MNERNCVCNSYYLKRQLVVILILYSYLYNIIDKLVVSSLSLLTFYRLVLEGMKMTWFRIIHMYLMMKFNLVITGT